MISHDRFPVKPTRHAPRSTAPFAAGLVIEPMPLRLSDDEQFLLDELSGDWPPAEALDDEDTPAGEWGAWADTYIFEPTEEEARWAAQTSPFADEHYDVIPPHPADVLGRSMIGVALARALASGSIDLF